MALVLGLIVNAVALWVATLIVPGISLYETAGDAGIDAGAIDNEVSGCVLDLNVARNVHVGVTAVGTRVAQNDF
ncbi:MAG: hypothetical protein Q7T31_06275, partial [Dietzia sp.]|nr:hypothetical protein [Dietzia sp.]